MIKKIFLGVILIILVGVGSACSSEMKKEESKKIKIVTTFYSMYEFTKQIVGDEADVDMLIPAGMEAHDYEPSAKDLKKLQESDIFVYNNENMETWVPSVKNVLKDGNVKVVKATDNMVLLKGDEEGHSHDHSKKGGSEHNHALDPHVWLAPNLAMKEVQTIRDELIKNYPDKKKIFMDNASNYLKKLSELDKSYKDTLSHAEQTDFVTQHAAFGYLAVEYGLTQIPIAGLSPDEEPSPAKLADLKKYVKENNIQYIYFESNASDAIAKTLASEAKVELLVLNPLEGLSKKELEEGKNYVSVMEENLKSLSKTTQSKNKANLKIATVEKEKTVENGYFQDDDVENRPLSNWAGEWQSVYPLLKEGTLDQVFDYKAKLNKDKTAADYKAYYEKGYKTDIKNIKITNSNITFTSDSGKSGTSEYKYKGYKILTYSAGNRGVRYMFEATNPKEDTYKYVQFSDHTITDKKVEHYHIYFGNESQEKLYGELENWPTYYKSDLTGLEVAQEMLAH